MLRSLTSAMQYKVTPQKDAQQDVTQGQNRIKSIEERKSKRVLQ